MGCSAVELNERNQQATAQAEADIASTVESRLATQSADRPVLVSDAELDGDSLTLEWSYTRELSADESYRVLIAPDGFPLALLTTTQSTTTDISEYVESNPADAYNWQIEIVRLDDNDETAEQIANPSEVASFSVIGVESIDVTATLESIFAQATTDAETIDEQISATLTAVAEVTVEPEITADPESTAEVTSEADPPTIPTSAEVVVYGTVPIDSDSLNSITALAFDGDGNLLVSLRNGDLYRLLDNDGDNWADDVSLIFEDSEDDIGQVSGIFVEDDVLYIVSGEQLTQLIDDDNEGDYETITTLTDDLPDNQALLQANNSIIRDAGGRYFTADVNTGDILLILFGDD